MAQMPTIASTAGRRILPSADLRVEGVSPAAFGAAVGAGLQQLGDAGADAGKAVQQFELVKQEEANRLAEFDRQTQFVAFGSDQATKLEEARRDLSGPAQDFTKTFMGGFDADATAFLEKVPPRDRHAWQTRMAQLRAGVAGDALRSEFGQRDAYYKTTISDSLEKLQNGAMQQPEKLADWLAQGEQIIGASGLSAQDKLEYVTRWKGAVSVAAAQGDIQRDPEGAMARLGGIDFIVETTGGGYQGAGASYTKGGAATLKGDIIDFFVRNGVPQHVARGIAAGIESESSGDHKAVNPSSGALGLGQWLGPRKAELIRRYGNNPTREQQLEFLLSELKGGDKGGPAVLSAKDEAQAVDRYIRGFMRPGKDTETGTQRGMKALGYKVQVGAPAGPNTTTRTVGTGEVDPRYADIPIDARVQLIGAAERQIDQREREVEAAEKQAHDERLNTFMTDLVDGKAGREDIEAARRSGVLTDYSEIAQATNIVEQREAKTAALDLYKAMLNGGGQFNPYDDNARKAVNAAFTEQAKVPGANPMQVAMNIWQRTGVLPDSGAVMLRGGLVSTDANQVAMAASIASNMIQRNPNAFAGVQGGSDIEQAAALYSHYVNDLGLTAQDAAQRVVQRNAPEARRRIDVNKPATDAFRAKLRKSDVGNMLSNAFGGLFTIDPEFTAPEQVNVAAQDYADFAMDHYEQHGDEAAAQTYAMQQTKKLYGAVNGRLMKFPPTRAYPAVQGSHDYIFEQAAGDIQRVTGRKIAPDKIYLMPIPSATAQAFRAGRPTPYSVHYIDTVGGQQVYRTLPGVAFTADVGAAQRAAAAKFDAARRERRRIDENTRAILRSRNRFGTYN